MMNRFKGYFTADYLLAPVSGTTLEIGYFAISLLILLLVFGFRFFLFVRKGRPEAYRFFDKVWFWGGISFGLTGLFIYFARTQALPIFSTRAVSYLWILCLVSFLAYLIYYYIKLLPAELESYYTKKRKAKYLRR